MWPKTRVVWETKGASLFIMCIKTSGCNCIWPLQPSSVALVFVLFFFRLFYVIKMEKYVSACSNKCCILFIVILMHYYSRGFCLSLSAASEHNVNPWTKKRKHRESVHPQPLTPLCALSVRANEWWINLGSPPGKLRWPFKLPPRKHSPLHTDHSTYHSNNLETMLCVFFVIMPIWLNFSVL